jgi:hypothetical protein
MGQAQRPPVQYKFGRLRAIQLLAPTGWLSSAHKFTLIDT